MRAKKIIYTIVTAILVSCACTSISSQSTPIYEFKKAKDSKYAHDIYLRKLHEYEDIFFTHPASLYHFNNFNRNRIKAKHLGFVSLGLILATPLLKSKVLPEGYVDPDPDYLVTVLASSSIAIITGSAAIIFKLKSNAAKAKAISIYNDDTNSFLAKDVSPVPSIVINKNGVGISFSL